MWMARYEHWVLLLLLLRRLLKTGGHGARLQQSSSAIKRTWALLVQWLCVFDSLLVFHIAMMLVERVQQFHLAWSFIITSHCYGTSTRRFYVLLAKDLRMDLAFELLLLILRLAW